MFNRLISTANWVIMAATTVISAVFHGGLFFIFGGGIFLALSSLSKNGGIDADGYSAIIIMFVFCMFHCFVFGCLLERTIRTRTWGYSVVTLVFEVFAIPAYIFVGSANSGMPYGKLLFVFAAMMAVSLIGNIYCVIRHTLTK